MKEGHGLTRWINKDAWTKREGWRRTKEENRLRDGEDGRDSIACKSIVELGTDRARDCSLLSRIMTGPLHDAGHASDQVLPLDAVYGALRIGWLVAQQSAERSHGGGSLVCSSQAKHRKRRATVINDRHLS